MRLLTCCLLALATPATAADEFKPEPGFELIFNGKDLTGWKTVGTKDKPGVSPDDRTEAFGGRFKVAGGELVIDPKVKGDVRIETARQFAGDVTVRFEFLPDAKCNNDLFFRGHKFDLSKENVKNIKAGEWNPIEIVVKGGTIVFTVNGEALRRAPVKVEKSTLAIRAEFGAIQIRRLRVKGGS